MKDKKHCFRQGGLRVTYTSTNDIDNWDMMAKPKECQKREKKLNLDNYNSNYLIEDVIKELNSKNTTDLHTRIKNKSSWFNIEYFVQCFSLAFITGYFGLGFGASIAVIMSVTILLKYLESFNNVIKDALSHLNYTKKSKLKELDEIESYRIKIDDIRTSMGESIDDEELLLFYSDELGKAETELIKLENKK